MDEERKVNIMSVDLALKRELAYRKKLARLYPEDDWTNELLTLEVPSSSTMSNLFPSSTDLSGAHSISVLNNVSPFSNSCLNPLSTPRIQSQDPVPCPWPNMEMANASTHSITREKSTANSFQCLPNNWPRPIYISNSANFFCKLCQVNCSGSVSFKQHIRGQKHKANLQKKQPTRHCSSGGENTCNQSNIRYPGEVEIHFNGQKRKARSQDVETGQKGKASQQFWCQLCQVACSHEDTYWLHLKGKTHTNNLKARAKISRGL